MKKKRIIKFIASAIVINNLSTTMVLGNEANSNKVVDHKGIKASDKDSKKVKNKTSFSNDIEGKTNFIEDYNPSLRERTVHTEREFLEVIKNSNVKSIKLETDLNLTKCIAEEVAIEVEGITIDGQGHSITVPLIDREGNNEFFTLKENDIIIKDTNFIVDNYYNKLLQKNSDVITVHGKNCEIENISVNGNFNNGLKVSDTENITLRNVLINSVNNKATGILVDNSKVACIGIEISGNGTGINVIGKKGLLNNIGYILIDTPINIRARTKDGSKIIDNTNQLQLAEKVFSYDYFKVV